MHRPHAHSRNVKRRWARFLPVLIAPLLTAAACQPRNQAGPAQGVWDRLAQCESGGNWSINTGNGYYGGLQFLPSTWRSAGGSGMPHQASRAEQIRVATNLRDSGQGYRPWPQCARKLGLL